MTDSAMDNFPCADRRPLSATHRRILGVGGSADHYAAVHTAQKHAGRSMGKACGPGRRGHRVRCAWQWATVKGWRGLVVSRYVRFYDEVGIQDVPLVGGQNTSSGERYPSADRYAQGA